MPARKVTNPHEEHPTDFPEYLAHCALAAAEEEAPEGTKLIMLVSQVPGTTAGERDSALGTNIEDEVETGEGLREVLQILLVQADAIAQTLGIKLEFEVEK